LYDTFQIIHGVKRLFRIENAEQREWEL